MEKTEEKEINETSYPFGFLLITILLFFPCAFEHLVRFLINLDILTTQYILICFQT